MPGVLTLQTKSTTRPPRRSIWRWNRKSSLGVRTFLSIMLVAGIAVAARAQDFYETRLQAGEAELRAGQPLQAITNLRIAAFGFLERPPLLCRALAALAVAQERAGRREDQQVALSRFVEVERRFAVYQKAEIPADMRSEFAGILRKHLPTATLNSLPAFSAAAPSPAPERRVAAGTTPPPPETERRVSESERRVSITPAAPRPAQPSSRADGGTSSPSESLEQPPRVRATVRPVYPADARKAGVSGSVLLRVLVSDSGIPLQVEIVHGIRSDLAEAAIAAVRQWRFEPARRGNRNVAAWTSVSVPFQH